MRKRDGLGEKSVGEAAGRAAGGAAGREAGEAGEKGEGEQRGIFVEVKEYIRYNTSVADIVLE